MEKNRPETTDIPILSKSCAQTGSPASADSGRIVDTLRSYAADEEGVTTVEIVLVLLVLIALVLIFKEQILKVLKSLMSKVSSQSNGV